MHLPDLPFVVLDTETTGFIPRVNRVIEFALVRVEEGNMTQKYEQLFSIPTSVPEPIQVLTRITPDALKGQPSFEEKRDEIAELIGDDTLIIGQNVSFDIRMLKGEGIDLSGHPWIDTSMLASLVFPELMSYSLGYVSTILQLRHDPVHRAMGDVNATLELLSRCWERLNELPPDLHELTQHIMSRSSPGYRLLFSRLPQPTAKTVPSWMHGTKPDAPAVPACSPLAEATLQKPAVGTVTLVEEPLSPTTLQQLLSSTVQDPDVTHWIAVKNIETALRRLPVPEGVRVLYPPSYLPDLAAARVLATQDEYNADEGTFALKLAWYEPQNRLGIPIHGNEYAIWNGKIACTDHSDAYRSQFEDLPGVVLLDHQQLLHFLADPGHVAHKALRKNAHIIIDDASMLEDTATKAYGWFCSLEDVRAGAEGNGALTSFLDILQIWIERTRVEQDVHYLVPAHLSSADANGLRERLDAVLDAALPPTLYEQLRELQLILDPKKLAGRISWIEQRQDGRQYIRSVPENIASILDEHLFSAFPTTLLIPPGSATTLGAVLATKKSLTTVPLEEPETLPILFDSEDSVPAFLSDPPSGKSIVLLPSRRLIEEYFVTFTEQLEEKGVRLICQNLSGGLERMQAEYLATPGPCVWLLTPWSYEGVTLPSSVVERLVLQSLPFDHPHDAVLSRRAERYRNAFEEYALPRLEHRLFRLLRAYCRHRTPEGSVLILDQRIEKKSYGQRIKEYLGQFTQHKERQAPQKKEKHGKPPRPSDQKPAREKGGTKKTKTKQAAENQLSLF